MPQAKKKKPKSARAAVRRPLTPEVLDEMGALKDWPPRGTGAPNTPLHYRIWTCHGYMKTGNADNGWLNLHCSQYLPNDRSGDRAYSMTCRQQVRHSDDRLHEMAGKLNATRKRRSPLKTPDTWSLISRFIDLRSSKEIADLTLRIRGERKNDQIIWNTNGKQHSTTFSGGLTMDWCLFEGIRHVAGKLETEKKTSFAGFDMLEGLTVLRPNQRLIYRGPEDTVIAGRKLRLYHISQIGQGILPYEYWIDEASRLVLVVTHSRAYILAPQAKFVETPKAE